MRLTEVTADKAAEWFNRPDFRPWYGGNGAISLPDTGVYYASPDGVVAFLPYGGLVWEMHVAAASQGVALGKAGIAKHREAYGGPIIARIPCFNYRARHGAVQGGGRFMGEIQNAVVYDGHAFALRYYTWDS